MFPGLQHNPEVALYRKVSIRQAELALLTVGYDGLNTRLVIHIAQGKRRAGTYRQPVIDLVGKGGLYLGCYQRKVHGTAASDPVVAPVKRQSEIVVDTDADTQPVRQGTDVTEVSRGHNTLVQAAGFASCCVVFILAEPRVDIHRERAGHHLRLVKAGHAGGVGKHGTGVVGPRHHPGTTVAHFRGITHFIDVSATGKSCAGQ